VLNPNFKDMLSALNDAGADYLIVGAYAMAAHGCPRSTGDIDFWVRPTAENARLVWQALKTFGAPTSQLTPEEFTIPDIVYQIGIAPQRIDLLTTISGIEFEAAWENRLTAAIDGIQASVIGRDDLLQNKLASGRPKDLIDAEILKSDDI
jgi:hypothetical protein